MTSLLVKMQIAATYRLPDGDWGKINEMIKALLDLDIWVQAVEFKSDAQSLDYAYEKGDSSVKLNGTFSKQELMEIAEGMQDT